MGSGKGVSPTFMYLHEYEEGVRVGREKERKKERKKERRGSQNAEYSRRERGYRQREAERERDGE